MVWMSVPTPKKINHASLLLLLCLAQLGNDVGRQRAGGEEEKEEDPQLSILVNLLLDKLRERIDRRNMTAGGRKGGVCRSIHFQYELLCWAIKLTIY